MNILLQFIIILVEKLQQPKKENFNPKLPRRIRETYFGKGRKDPDP
jgi:hypothetical protein